MKIVLLYELPQRDLENVLLLKAYLTQKGYRSDIVKFPYVDPIGLRRKYYNLVDMIIVHSLYDDSVINNLVYSIFGKVRYIVNLQIEQVDTNNAENDPKSYGHPKGNAVYGYHVCWGDRMAERLMACGVSEDHLIKCGPIQMDFLRDEFIGYYFSKEDILKKYNISVNKKLALFISSFSYVGLRDAARKELSRKIGIQRFEKFEKLSLDSQHGIIEWFSTYLKENSDVVIIYRKHPAEYLMEEVVTLSRDYPDRFRLISDYSVKQWIHVSDLVLNWYSTAAAEAYFDNKSVLVLRPIPINYGEEVSILNGAKTISSYEEFLNAVSSGKYDTVLDELVMKQYFDVSKDTPSYLRLGEKITKIIETLPEGFPWDRYNYKLFDRINNRNRSIVRLYKPYKNILFILDYTMKKFKISYPEEIMKRIKSQKNEKEKIRNESEEAERLEEKTWILERIVKRNINAVG